MSRSVLETAQNLLKRRKFSLAINLMESNMELYERSFDFFYILGTACLYVGDAGNAASYYSRAREIKLTDSRLLLGQAAIFLRRGDTDRAIQYYIDVLTNDPQNKIAKSAMEFIRKYGDYNIICQWVDTGKIERFYPPLGMNPDIIRNILLVLILCGAGFALYTWLKPKTENHSVGPRANLEKLELTSAEQKNALEKDLSNTVVRYLLTNEQINESYEKSMEYFQQHRDNASLVEINRLLNSNAAYSVKQKASTLLSYLVEPAFDTLLDNYSYSQVAEDPVLYMDCYVIWSGRISNARELNNGGWSCDLLVGYENMKTVEGIVPLIFTPAPSPEIDGERAVQVLAKITDDGGRIVLKGKAVYQPLMGKELPKK